ncbi:hypothetical protein JCM9492_13620 [Aquifex pyrophilus]
MLMRKKITVHLTEEAYEIIKEVPPRLKGFVISRALIEAKKSGLIDLLLGKTSEEKAKPQKATPNEGFLGDEEEEEEIKLEL